MISVGGMKVFRKPAGAGDAGPDRSRAMACVPVKNGDIREERLESGAVLIHYPVVPRPWVRGILKRLNRLPDAPQLKKLQLDTLGSAVWGLIDGKRSVRQLIDRFAAQYQLQAREAEVSVTQFLRELGRRGLVAMK